MKRMDSIGKKYFERDHHQDTMDQILPHRHQQSADREDRFLGTQPPPSGGEGGVNKADKI